MIESPQDMGKFLKLSLIVSVVLVTTWGMFYRVPVHHQYFFWTRLLSTWADIGLGILCFPVRMAAYAPWFFFVPAMIVCGGLVGLTVGLVWVEGPLSRLVLLGMLIANSLGGLFTTAIAGTYVERPYVACEGSVGEALRIKVKVYTEYAWPKGEHFFVLATDRVTGEWQQVLYHRRDNPQFNNRDICKNIGVLDAQVYWVWIDQEAAISKDGGATWQTLDTEDLPEY